jgi:putative ABC transport system permease protein
MNGADITWFELFLGSLVLIIPFWLLIHYKTGLFKDALIAHSRMILQLMLVGIYLKVIFKIDSIAINLSWVTLMIIAASFSISKRSNLKVKTMFLPISIAILVNVLINGSVLAFFVVGTDHFLTARYLIPLMGMIVGNTLNSSIVGIRSFFNQLSKNEEQYRYNLICGATKSESIFSFTSRAMQEAFNPVIASTAVMGLIWLPGMMTGQILGGSDPIIAIKFQIMIIVTIFAGSVITVFVSILIAKLIAFDEYDLLKTDLFIKGTNKG